MLIVWFTIEYIVIIKNIRQVVIDYILPINFMVKQVVPTLIMIIS